MDRASAFSLAKQFVARLAQKSGGNFEIYEEEIIETPHGWLFFYNQAEYIRRGNLSAALAGNGPIFVRPDGAVHSLPSYKPWQEPVDLIVGAD